MKKWLNAKELLNKEELEYILSFQKNYLHLSQSEFEWNIADKLAEFGISGRWNSEYGYYVYRVPNYFYGDEE